MEKEKLGNSPKREVKILFINLTIYYGVQWAEGRFEFLNFQLCVCGTGGWADGVGYLPFIYILLTKHFSIRERKVSLEDFVKIDRGDLGSD